MWAFPHLFVLIAIPLIAAAAGWTIAWVALKLTLYPSRFLGLSPWLGWQGILPRRAGHVGRVVVRASLGKIGTAGEVFETLDPRLMGTHFVHALTPWVPVYTRDVLFEAYPRLSKYMPEWAVRRVAKQVQDRLPAVVDGILEELVKNIDDLLDIEWLATRVLGRHPEILVEIFEACGAKEFRLLIRASALFGFLFGCIQAAVWAGFGGPLVLVLSGILFGALTLWTALALLFFPVEPVHIGPFRWQGAFLRHRDEISTTFCALVATRILTFSNIADTLLEGPNGGEVRALITARLNAEIDETLRGTDAILSIAKQQGIDVGLGRVRASMSQTVVRAFNTPFHDLPFALGRQHLIAEHLEARMREVPPAQFQALLRPAFQAYEPLLFLAGGIVGGVLGVVQTGLYFIIALL